MVSNRLLTSFVKILANFAVSCFIVVFACSGHFLFAPRQAEMGLGAVRKGRRPHWSAFSLTLATGQLKRIILLPFNWLHCLQSGWILYGQLSPPRHIGLIWSFVSLMSGSLRPQHGQV